MLSITIYDHLKFYMLILNYYVGLRSFYHIRIRLRTFFGNGAPPAAPVLRDSSLENKKTTGNQLYPWSFRGGAARSAAAFPASPSLGKGFLHLVKKALTLFVLPRVEGIIKPLKRLLLAIAQLMGHFNIHMDVQMPPGV